MGSEALGIGIFGAKRARIVGVLGALAVLLALTPAAALEKTARLAGRTVSVIVRAGAGSSEEAEGAVQRAGGSIGRRIPIINAFEADVPTGALRELKTSPAVQAVTPNGPVRLMGNGEVEPASGGTGQNDCSEGLGFDPTAEPGSMLNVTGAIHAGALWSRGFRGGGVDVALIDSGVVPVDGLDADKIIDGPDLSFESQSDSMRHLDTYGHGTHMAGIIAGRSSAAVLSGSERQDNCGQFVGVAPESRIVSVKVANEVGATDVSQVLAAINWVVEHRNDNGMNIRVLNLSFGTDGVQDYVVDPLTYAAEVAWRHGIVVVVAAGNTDQGSAKLSNPAYDPFVIAVGATDTNGTFPIADDFVPEWSAPGDGTRNPDVVAPGRSVVSLRDPNSMIDAMHPEGRLGERFFKGSGTSQAAAVASGAAALLLSQRPYLTPDQVKALLTSSARRLVSADPVAQGAGLIDLQAAGRSPVPNVVQNFTPATGTGSLEASRGTAHIVADAEPLTGEQDIFGRPWDAEAWAQAAGEARAWTGGAWNGSVWTGDGWNDVTWSGHTWDGHTWDGHTWDGHTWDGHTWDGHTWDGHTWDGHTWDGHTWDGHTWDGHTWDGHTWDGHTWDGHTWD